MSAEPNIVEDVLPEQILQAALQLYLKYGVKKVTMDDVAKLIGKSRTAIYYYYKNRDEIFDAVMQTLVHEVLGEIRQETDKADNLQAKLRAFCLAKIKSSESRRTIFSAMEQGMDADEISRHTQTMNSLHKQMMKGEAALLKSIISEGRANENIRPLKTKEMERLIFVLLSGIRGIKREMNHENDFSDMDAVIGTLVGMAMRWLEK